MKLFAIRNGLSYIAHSVTSGVIVEISRVCENAGRDLQTTRLSAGNILCGNVTKIVPGAVNTEITVRLSGENTICAVITNESARFLAFSEGDYAGALFQASNVILGVD